MPQMTFSQTMVTTHKNSIKSNNNYKNYSVKNQPVTKNFNNKNLNGNKNKNPRPNVYKNKSKNVYKSNYKSEDITFRYYYRNEDKKQEKDKNHIKNFYNIVKNENITYLDIKNISNNLNSFNKHFNNKEKMLFIKLNKKQYHLIINNLRDSVSNINYKNYKLCNIIKEN